MIKQIDEEKVNGVNIHMRLFVENAFIKTKNEIKDFYHKIGSRKEYYLSLLIISILSFGFSIFNRTVSIDDLFTDYYVGSGKLMISATRWGFTLYAALFGQTEYMPFVFDFLAVLSLIAGAFLVSCLIYKYTKYNNHWAYIIFSCLYVSFPLLNEIFEYTGANFAVYFGIALSALVILFVSNTENNLLILSIIYGLIYSPVISSYEASCFVYVLLVLICMYLKYRNDIKTNWNWLSDGIRYALPLIFALIFRVLIGFILIKLNNIAYKPNGDTFIYYFFNGTKYLAWVFVENILRYVIEWNYMPVFEFSIFTLIFIIISIKESKRNKSILVLNTFIVISVFFLSILQGKSLEYRQAQTVQMFTAFCGYLMIEKTEKKALINKIITIVLLFICLRQSIYLHQILALNNQRSDNEAAIIQNIGYKIYSEFDKDKEVIFVVGDYELSNNINNQILSSNSLYSRTKNYIKKIINKNSVIIDEGYKYIDTNINPLLSWSIGAKDFTGNVEKLFSYYGFDINVNQEKCNEKEYLDIAKNLNMKPFEIVDLGKNLLVCIGEIK